MTAPQKFDGIAAAYDRRRPRYPASLVRTIVDRLPVDGSPLVVDAGAGTGIALEGFVPMLPKSTRILAVDLSADMTETGRAKFPNIAWSVGAAEPFLERFSGEVSLIVAAQAYQWMDRPRFLAAACHGLRDGGVLAILQNNRDYRSSSFLDAYEGLLEAHSPRYRRNYRDFDIAAELDAVFGDRVSRHTAVWSHRMTVNDFVEMSSSSTQAQRAIATNPGFLQRVTALANTHAADGLVDVPYRSEAFLGRK